MRSTVWLRAVLSTTVLFVAVGLGTLGSAQGWLGAFRAQIVDTQYPTGPIDERILVVELPPCAEVVEGIVADDEVLDGSLCDRFGGRMRPLHAAVIRALAPAAVVGYDVVFDQDRGTPEDEELRAAIADAGNVVLGSSASLTVGGANGTLLWIDGTDPAPGFVEVAADTAHTSVLLSPLDGLVRHVPLVIDDGRQWVPSLAFAAVSLDRGLDPELARVFSEPLVGDESGARIPTDWRKALEVNWAWEYVPANSPGGDPIGDLRVSADALLAGQVDVTDRIAFVGVADRLLDWRETPVNNAGAPGVHVHAQAANTLLTNLFRSGPDPVTAFFGMLLMVGAVVIGGTVVRRLRWIPAIALACLVVWQGYVNVQHQHGVAVDNLWPVLAVLAAAAGVTGTRYVFEERHKRRVAGLFKQYVPDAVAEQLIDSDRAVAAAEGERIEVTVLFCDLRGFTRTAAALPPRTVREMLEVYYDHSTRIIHQHGGTVMQFVGDEVFAVFGAPTVQTDHPQRALDCAVHMQQAAALINAELADRGVELSYGIGINTGLVVAAHVGSQVHKQYAVVGNTVNVGARLCSLATPGGVVISIHTLQQLDRRPPVEELPPVELKGVQEDPRPHRVVVEDLHA